MEETSDNILGRVNARITSLRKNKYYVKTSKLVSTLFVVMW